MARLLTLAVLALLPMLASAEGYICVEDKSTGFLFQNGSWEQVRFKANGKFIVRPATPKDRDLLAALFDPYADEAKWIVMNLGDKVPVAGCSGDFGAGGHHNCVRGLQEFRMNNKSLRFLYIYAAGYWNATSGDEAGDTPRMSIGKCSPM